MAPYAPAAEGRPRVMDFVDADSEKWRDYAARSAGPAAWIYARGRPAGAPSRRPWRACGTSRSSSASGKRASSARAPGAAVGVIVNGIDTEFFAARRAGRRRERIRPSGTVRQRVVFTGMMDYFPNADGVRWFADEIFPRVREAPPAPASRSSAATRPAP